MTKLKCTKLKCIVKRPDIDPIPQNIPHDTFKFMNDYMNKVHKISIYKQWQSRNTEMIFNQ